MGDGLQAALSLLHRGELSAALVAFDELLKSAPDDVPTLSAYASALRRAGRIDAALELYGRALQLSPLEPALHFNQANALRAAKQTDAARKAYAEALRINPQMAPAWVNLGRLEQDQGRYEQAVQAYAQALALDPRQLTAAMNRGNCLRQLNRLEEAVHSHRQALALAPRSAELHYNLGNALLDLGERSAALDAFRAALQAGPAPAELWSRLGAGLQQLGQAQQALAAFDRGRREHPQSPTALCNYGHMAIRMRQMQAGIEALRLAVQLEPGEPVATAHLVDALVRTGFIAEATGLAAAALARASSDADQARLHNVLGNAYGSAGEVEAALTHLQQAHQLEPSASALSNLAFMTLYREDMDAAAKAERQRELAAGLVGLSSARSPAVGALELDVQSASAFAASKARTTAALRGGGRLRVGYISADLLEHPVGYFMQPLLRSHDRAQFEVFVYSDAERSDALSHQLQADSEHWRAVSGLSDPALLERMAADQLDLLIELGGHTAGNRLPLLARRPAPVQLSYLGYPFTTGLAAIDGLIGDAVTTPASEDQMYSERVLRLPHFPFCFQPHPTAPAVAPAPVLQRGHLTFGCCNSFSKVGPRTLALWARLLRSLPQTRLLLRALGLNDVATCERVRAVFEQADVDPSRVELLPPTRPIEAYLASYEQIDIALDPLAYNGGTTSFEALWQGVPVLTVAGTGFCARMGTGINATAGLDEFTAHDEDDFLRLAASWAAKPEALATLRAGLRDRLAQTSLFDPGRFMPGFEDALREAVGLAD